MSDTISVPVRILENGRGLNLPHYATDQAAGLDLLAATDVTLAPAQRALVPTGFAIALPTGYEAQIRPRSGLALKHGVTVLNAPGTIDADYRGEVAVILINHGDKPISLARGDRIAQMVIAPVTRIAWALGETLDETARGAGGFGSTAGVSACSD